jgi:hypothetical protein
MKQTSKPSNLASTGNQTPSKPGKPINPIKQSKPNKPSIIDLQITQSASEHNIMPSKALHIYLFDQMNSLLNYKKHTLFSYCCHHDLLSQFKIQHIGG